MRKADYFAPTVKADVSGCTFFRGEDHEEEDRKRAHQQEQREYLMRQMEENKHKKNFNHKTDMMYDTQRMVMTRQVDFNH